MSNGKLNVISGRRGARKALEAEGLSEKFRPQTRHLEALSLKRVPQVGQTFVDAKFFSGVIVYALYWKAAVLYHSSFNENLDDKEKKLNSLYIHLPFCLHRCKYCDFNTYDDKQSLIPAYLESLCKEADWCEKVYKDIGTFHTLYFGGGTPSVIPMDLLLKVVRSVSKTFPWTKSREVTLEMNPGTANARDLDLYRENGINRISFGAQSFDSHELEMLGRIHTAREIEDAFLAARSAGFQNINLDLMYGLPGQKIDIWKRSLFKALDLDPDHLSLYALTLDENAPLAVAIRAGKLPQIDDDQTADMYLFARELLASRGYAHYEISNWAKSDPENDYRCKHNLQYWRNLPYIGLGAGAHSHIHHNRWENVLSPETYIDNIYDDSPSSQPPAKLSGFDVSLEREISETMVMGLRLVDEGVSERAFFQRFNLKLTEYYASKISLLINRDLIEMISGFGTDRIIRLSKKGHLLANVVMREFI